MLWCSRKRLPLWGCSWKRLPVRELKPEMGTPRGPSLPTNQRAKLCCNKGPSLPSHACAPPTAMSGEASTGTDHSIERLCCIFFAVPGKEHFIMLL
eukprot:scaffold34200_cov17-Tisochrysis_lutea.AAC.1